MIGELSRDAGDTAFEDVLQSHKCKQRYISVSHLYFYHATHVVLARYCYRKLSVRPFVCDVEVPWAYMLS